MEDSLRFLPDLLPTTERLVFEPTVMGSKGRVTLSSSKKDGIVQLKLEAKLGMLLRPKLVDFMAQSVWTVDGESRLLDYSEENILSGKRREFSKAPESSEHTILDPLALFLSFRAPEVLEPVSHKAQVLYRGSQIIPVQFQIVGVEERVFSFLGRTARRQVVFEGGLTEGPWTKFKLRLWIDRQLGIPTGFAAAIPVFGHSGLRLIEYSYGGS